MRDFADKSWLERRYTAPGLLWLLGLLAWWALVLVALPDYDNPAKVIARARPACCAGHAAPHAVPAATREGRADQHA